MDVMVVKVLGVVLLSLVFVVTVLLMPWIFGVSSPSTTAQTGEGAPPPAPAAVAAPPVSVPSPLERPLKG